MAANDDLVVETGIHPNDPVRSGSFVRNKNRDRGIVANVVIDAAAQHTLYAGDFMTSRQRWPQSYEVRIPPGGVVLVGFKDAEVWLSINGRDPNDATKVTRHILQQSFTISGAYYADPPWPAKNERPKDYLWFYSIPFYHDVWSEMQLGVSVHPNRTLDCEVWDDVNKESFRFSLLPGRHKVIHASTNQPYFRIDSCDFVGPPSAAKGLMQKDPRNSSV